MIEFTRIENDQNGNGRLVCHYINLLTEAEKQGEAGDRYALAVKRAHRIGGRKYHTKRYGGGIVFQAYSEEELDRRIRAILPPLAPMTAEEFGARLSQIVTETNQEVVALVHEAQERAGLGIETDQSVPFADDPNWNRPADSLAESAGWIYDRLNGRTGLHRQSMTKKIRRALGYTSP